LTGPHFQFITSPIVQLKRREHITREPSGGGAADSSGGELDAARSHICSGAPIALRLSDPRALERAAGLFRAAGDVARLRLLELLSQREWCVSELAEALGEGVSTVSQRLRVLRAEHLVVRRREGKHVHYALVDHHVVDLIRAALAHAEELVAPRWALAAAPVERSPAVTAPNAGSPGERSLPDPPRRKPLAGNE
jgi:ArsR family transcriptional regulator, lead/cadmium/zinc/bismuth-responsive transcriptional repressor